MEQQLTTEAQAAAIRFTVPAVPVAQPRQRHAMIAGHIRNYTPTKHPVNVFKAACQMACASAYTGPPLTGPVSLRILFVLPRPASTPKRNSGRTPHAKKPDCENLAKAVMDSLTGTLYADDRQVYLLRIGKLVAGINEAPHVEVEAHA